MRACVAIALAALFLASCGAVRNGGGLIANSTGPDRGYIIFYEDGKPKRIYVGEDAWRNSASENR